MRVYLSNFDVSVVMITLCVVEMLSVCSGSLVSL